MVGRGVGRWSVVSPLDTPIGFQGKGTATLAMCTAGCLTRRWTSATQRKPNAAICPAQCLRSVTSRNSGRAIFCYLCRRKSNSMAALSFELRHNIGLNREKHGPEDQHGSRWNTYAHFMPVGTVGEAVTQPQLKQEIKAQIIPVTPIIYTCAHNGCARGSGQGYTNLWVGKTPYLRIVASHQVFARSKQEDTGRRRCVPKPYRRKPAFVYPGERYGYSAEHGADIIMAFWWMPAYPSEYAYAKKSMDLTHRWLSRCFTRFNETDGKYGTSKTFSRSCRAAPSPTCEKLPANSLLRKMQRNAIGGLSVGEPEHMMYELTDLCTDNLPYEKPRFGWALAHPGIFFECISLGLICSIA